MLADYRRRVKAQFDVLEQDTQTQRDKFDTIVARVKLVLDCVDLEVAPQPDGRPPCPDIVIERCKTTFESFNCDVVVTGITHALVVVQSHYQSVDLQAIGAELVEGLSEVETQQLEDAVEDAAKKVVGDIDLFGETSGNGEAW